MKLFKKIIKKIKSFFSRIPAWKTYSNPLEDFNSIINWFETQSKIKLEDWQKEPYNYNINLPRGNLKLTLHRLSIKKMIHQSMLDIARKSSVNKADLIIMDELNWITKEELEEMKKNISEWQFREEYLCEWIPDERQVELEENGVVITKCRFCEVEFQTTNLRRVYCCDYCHSQDNKLFIQKAA